MKNIFNIILFFIYIIFSVGGLILFKIGSGGTKINLYKNFLNLNIDINMLLGILCYGISFILWLFIVSKFNLSYIVPMSVGMVNILILFGSKYFLNESISFLKVLGILIILLGLFIINYSN